MIVLNEEGRHKHINGLILFLRFLKTDKPLWSDRNQSNVSFQEVDGGCCWKGNEESFWAHGNALYLFLGDD